MLALRPESMDVNSSLQSIEENPLIAERNPPQILSTLTDYNTLQFGRPAETISDHQPQPKVPMACGSVHGKLFTILLL